MGGVPACLHQRAVRHSNGGVTMQTPARPTRQTSKVSWLAGLLLSLFLLLTVAPAAAAAGPVTASGTVVQASFQVTSSRSADGVTILDYAEMDLLSGAFSGTSS